MNTTISDLSNCDQEPIHIPGQIQSHGFLIAIDTNYIVRYHSENIDLWSGLPNSILGKNIEDLAFEFSETNDFKNVRDLIEFGSKNGFEYKNASYIEINGISFYLILSYNSPYYLLEFEPAVKGQEQEVQKMMGHSISAMLSDRDLSHLLQNTAIQVKNIIKYDRIMVYRFAEDGHGEVVAEAKNDTLLPLFGLHYPASDIPEQARTLYKINLTRLIADVHAIPVRIMTSSVYSDPIDLTYSQLRAVSPIHIQYLKNMGVCSSFSISIICNNQLWGLIACHNYTPQFIDYKARESAKLIGQIFSSALEFRIDQQDQEIFGHYKLGVDNLTKNLLKSDHIRDALTNHKITLMDAVDASGAVFVYENQISKIGKTPNDLQLLKLILWLQENIKQQFFFTSELSKIYSEAAEFKDIACGMLVSVLSREDAVYAIWFKPEVIQTINWGGDPYKRSQTDSDLGQISPRNSFEIWSETVAGRSANWNNEEIKSVTRLREEIIFTINQKASVLKALNEKLESAYQELDTFSFTIAHDLKNPLTSIKGYADLLKMNDDNTPDVEHSIDRIIASATRMNRMISEILEYSRIGRYEIEPVRIKIKPMLMEFIKDLNVAYNQTNIEFDVGETPDVFGDQLMISQVFINLLSNAIKYSQNSSLVKIRISGLASINQVTYSISDNGMGIETKDIPKIFDLFQRLNNVKDIEGSGVGLAIVKRIIDRHKGTIQVESILDVGSVFYVTFKNDY